MKFTNVQVQFKQNLRELINKFVIDTFDNRFKNGAGEISSKSCFKKCFIGYTLTCNENWQLCC